MAWSAQRVDDVTVEGLPSGTVTLLFSDMEGSTSLLTRLGERYADALDAQRSILRRAWVEHGGHELGTEGDSFFVVFASAGDAVRAVVAGQRDLAAFDWPGGEQVRVRMGLHTGSPVQHDGAYVGIDVHRAARIAASAHGGQIVLSAASAGLVSGALPDGVVLRDLGEHRFKDLESPEHVFQLDVRGLGTEFRPLRSLGASSILPTRDAPLLGRDSDIARLSSIVRDGARRVLTLTGPGGTGKTSLAIELAHSLVDEFPGGVYFTGLAAVGDVEAAWTALAEVLSLSEGRGADEVAAFLRPRRALVVLDNLEQIDGASKLVHTLVSECPDLVVFATSRRPLHLAIEQEYPLSPLGLPDDDAAESVGASAAPQLFARAAGRVRPSFAITAENAADVAEICRRVDGMPLAIELAAARSRLLSPHALLARLGDALGLASADVDRPSRHHTLRETIAWSYELLGPEQQTFFRRLGAFVGGADLAAAAAVCLDHDSPFDVLDLVADLVDASLATIEDGPDGEPRVTQLETLRAFARERLDASDDAERTHERHARHFLDQAKDVTESVDNVVRSRRIERLSGERPNVVAALEWAVGDGAAADDGRTDFALALLGAACPVWTDEWLRDGIDWLERALTRADDRATPGVVNCLAALSNYLRFAGEFERAHEYAHRSLDMLDLVEAPPRLEAWVCRTVAIADFEVEQFDELPRLCERAIAAARADGTGHVIWQAVSEAGWYAMARRDFAAIRTLTQTGLELATTTKNTPAQVDAQIILARVAYWEGDADEAERLMRAELAQAVNFGRAVDVCEWMDWYAAVLADVGRLADAALLVGSANAWNEERDMTRNLQEWIDLEPVYRARDGSLSVAEWGHAYRKGAAMPVRDALLAVLQSASANADR